MARLIHYHYTRPGKDTKVFDQWLVVDDPDVKVLLLTAHDGHGIGVAGKTVLERRAPVLWYVFPGAWYDIGRFHLADGTFTGWYTNLCTPVSLDGDTWSSTDLFLDHWLSATGSPEWLDEHEFVAAAREGAIGHDARVRVTDERRFIESRLGLGEWPPNVARHLDLAKAHNLLGW